MERQQEELQSLLVLAGAKGAGKALLRGLLDGHKNVFVSPFHELLRLLFPTAIGQSGLLKIVIFSN